MWRKLAWIGFSVEYFLLTFIGLIIWAFIVAGVEYWLDRRDIKDSQLQ